MLERVSRAQPQAESETLRQALDAVHWNRKKAAAALGIGYKSLLYRMKKHGLDVADDAPGKARGAAV
jgi:DNA-binding NtrC family response regulator